MVLSQAASLAGLALGACAQAAGLLIWGSGLTQRVARLEEEVRTLRSLPERFARIEVRLDGMLERLTDISSSIRRLREPAD